MSLAFEVLKYREEQELFELIKKFDAFESDIHEINTLWVYWQTGGHESRDFFEEELQQITIRLDTAAIFDEHWISGSVSFDELTDIIIQAKNTEHTHVGQIGNAVASDFTNNYNKLLSEAKEKKSKLINKTKVKIRMYGLFALTGPAGILGFLVYAYFFSLRRNEH